MRKITFVPQLIHETRIAQTRTAINKITKQTDIDGVIRCATVFWVLPKQWSWRFPYESRREMEIPENQLDRA